MVTIERKEVKTLGLQARARAVRAEKLARIDADEQARTAKLYHQRATRLAEYVQALTGEPCGRIYGVLYAPDEDTLHGPWTDIDGLIFGLDSRNDLAVFYACSDCSEAAHSYRIASLDDLGAWLDHDWRKCRACSIKPQTPPSPSAAESPAPTLAQQLANVVRAIVREELEARGE